MDSEESSLPSSTSSGQNFSSQSSNMGHGMHGMWHPYSLPPSQHHTYADRYHHQHYPHYYSHINVGQHPMQHQQTSQQHQAQASKAMAVSRPLIPAQSIVQSIVTSAMSSPGPPLSSTSLGSGAILRQAIQQSASSSNHHHHQNTQEMQVGGAVLQQVLTHGTSGTVPVQTMPGISLAVTPQSKTPALTHSLPSTQIFPNNKILSRGRLQELVREVDPNEQLDEDVEEMLIQIAEDFVDSALNGACLLAKHRKSNTVDIKDLELHLERNWNMWIPGFGTDELRPYKRSFVTEAHKQRLSLIRKNLKKY